MEETLYEGPSQRIIGQQRVTLANKNKRLLSSILTELNLQAITTVERLTMMKSICLEVRTVTITLFSVDTSETIP